MSENFKNFGNFQNFKSVENFCGDSAITTGEESMSASRLPLASKGLRLTLLISDKRALLHLIRNNVL